MSYLLAIRSPPLDRVNSPDLHTGLFSSAHHVALFALSNAGSSISFWTIAACFPISLGIARLAAHVTGLVALARLIYFTGLFHLRTPNSPDRLTGLFSLRMNVARTFHSARPTFLAPIAAPMKCDFPKHENVCKRCKAGGHHCVVEGRKPRSAPNKREYLLAQIRQKDVIIESLLKQLHNPYLATPLSIAAYRMATPSSDNHRQNVIAWLDRMQSSVRRTPGAGAGFTLPREMPADDESDGGSETAPEHESDEPPTSAHTLVDPEAETYPGLPDTAVPLGLLANLSISNSKQKGKSALADLARAEDPNDDDDNVGVANDTYFLPGPAQDLALRAMLIDKSSPPDILVHGLVSPEDVDKLFEIFYTKVNPFIGVLDPALHTPATTFSRCPFLFTVVCATALRYSDKSEVYPIAMHFAKSAAANALIDGWKSVELCQAYILMSIYAVPARRWEEDRSWLYTGLATDLKERLFVSVLSRVNDHRARSDLVPGLDRGRNAPRATVRLSRFLSI
ncbi:hypothetical protein EWM64_g7100 [Hericium alpestre]|uniref:Transcription factor domain-containing protein n=1 Tax=Hericium alpestre TaxID=135208 RepID=A0A4Y9ZQ53_9AGAM|nr:hypothetical protein EWM64_g7100 [Hericium alpestre]